MPEFIKIEEKAQTGVISFIRPDVYNAMNLQMKAEIGKAIRELNKSANIRSIIITGEGKAFCSGQDLNDRSIDKGNGPIDLGNTLETEWLPLVESIHNSGKPVIAAVNGVVAGAGLSVALASDLIVSKPKVKFVSGFAKLGLAPDAGSTRIITHAFGRQKAYEYFLLDAPLLAEDFHSKGLVNQIDEDPLTAALALAEKINKMAPLSIKNIKENILFAEDETRKACYVREVQVQRLLGNSNDYAEGVSAFKEKRAAQFKGE